MARQSTPVSRAAPPDETVACTIGSHGLLRPTDHVLVAFSGGADSTALAIVLKNLGYRITLGHVDHGMRAGSDADADHCKLAGERLGLPIQIASVRVAPATEANARVVRYEALERIAFCSGADRIATGHTYDDQAETVRMRLDRGGFGLGIPYQRGLVVRPILDLPRAQTEQICRDAGVTFLTDPSNSDPRFTRNRIRGQLADAGEQASRKLVLLGNRSRATVEQIGRDAARAMEAVEYVEGAARIDRPALARLAPPVARGVVRLMMQGLGLSPSAQLVSDVVRKIVPVNGAALDLPSGLAVWSEPRFLLMGSGPQTCELPEVRLVAGQTTLSTEWGLIFCVETRPLPVIFPASSDPGQYFDAERLAGDLAVRQARPGDRFRPLGLGGSKKLQDFFIDAKVPRGRRHSVPVLLCNDRVAWVVGHRIDERFKLTGNSVGAVHVRVKPAEDSTADAFAVNPPASIARRSAACVRQV